MSDDVQDNLDKLFAHGRQLWLLGAGASFASNLPLIAVLTLRVRTKLATRKIDRASGDPLGVAGVIDSLAADIGKDPTIEQILDHLADHLSMAQRTASKTAVIRSTTGATAKMEEITYDELSEVRTAILSEIRETLRWGYRHDHDPGKIEVGTRDKPIVLIEHHTAFIDTVFGILRAGRQFHTQPIEFFTTNYDTLIEDALALRGIPYADGFRGGAVGFFEPGLYDDAQIRGSSIRASVTKIHGSIDWSRIEGGRIVRRRIGDAYPTSTDDILIYPQASKYDLARREPFDTLFQRFRTVLARPEPQVLFACGYGFGDDHVDLEIVQALARTGSNLTLVVFCSKPKGKPADWLKEAFGERVNLVTGEGIFQGSLAPAMCPEDGKLHDWWTFTGMTKLLRTAGDLL